MTGQRALVAGGQRGGERRAAAMDARGKAPPRGGCAVCGRYSSALAPAHAPCSAPRTLQEKQWPPPLVTFCRAPAAAPRASPPCRRPPRAAPLGCQPGWGRAGALRWDGRIAVARDGRGGGGGGDSGVTFRVPRNAAPAGARRGGARRRCRRPSAASGPPRCLVMTLTRHLGPLGHLPLLVRHLCRPELGRRRGVQRPRLLARRDHRRLLRPRHVRGLDPVLVAVGRGAGPHC